MSINNCMRDLLLERIYQQVPDDVYEGILQLTKTSGKQANAITKWFCKMYLEGHFPTFDENRYDYGYDLYFGYLRYRRKLKPIMDYQTPDELEDDILKIINSGYKSRSDLDKLARDASEQVYKSRNYLVLKINDYIAARKYGKNTRWCISANLYPDTFNDYNERSDCYFIIDRKSNEKKYACVDGKCWDEYDSVIFTAPGNEDAFDELISGYRGDANELYWRIKESPELYDVLPLAFPQFNKEDIQKQIDRILKYSEYPKNNIEK